MEKVTFIQANNLYGDTEISGYGKEGLAIHKVKSGWTISQMSSGTQISSRAVFKTKAEATAKMEELLALDIKWDLPWSEMSRAFSVNAEDIRSIVHA